jgi:hypothetical protein
MFIESCIYNLHSKHSLFVPYLGRHNTIQRNLSSLFLYNCLSEDGADTVDKDVWNPLVGPTENVNSSMEACFK